MPVQLFNRADIEMKKAMGRGAFWAGALAVMAALAGCGMVVTLDADLEKYDTNRNQIKPTPTQDPFLVEASHRFGLMAFFAEEVYRRSHSEKAHVGGQGCKGPEPGHRLPHDSNGAWERWTAPQANGSVQPCFDHSGLYYETFIYRTRGRGDLAGKVTTAVIAYRGTENRSGQLIPDWSSNILAVFGFEPPQYRRASELTRPLVKGLKAEFGNSIKVYATGHSLGGGLAQQAGYLSTEVEEVFAFNSSPVTNWSHLRRRSAVENGYPIFHRIYHAGEFLEKVRFITTAFTDTRFGRTDIGFVFDERSNFKGHSMKIIACSFAKVISLHSKQQPMHGMATDLQAQHHYPVSYIEDVVWDKDKVETREAQLCSDSTEPAKQDVAQTFPGGN